jgi:hypothetical protein
MLELFEDDVEDDEDDEDEDELLLLLVENEKTLGLDGGAGRTEARPISE